MNKKLIDGLSLVIPIFKDQQYGEAKGGGGSIRNRIALIKRTIKYINSTKQQSL